MFCCLYKLIVNSYLSFINDKTLIFTKKYLLSDKKSMTIDLIKLLITEPVGGINSACTVEISFFIDKSL